MNTLFESQVSRPLADRLRPQSIDEVVGQDHLLGEADPDNNIVEGALRRLLSLGMLSSLVLWGPPGTGKTTIGSVFGRGRS